ncbi:hypothetical protein [Nitrosococcus oceani]|uniref:Uncharacterized protein n=2 Tax=Nitrosococcus oceani TaxID=1229 RepID=Q3JE37_NITOC|nr:hypothetical protein [Nitrosococcus oceani]ABA56909.1 hypothetical protein Noc_0383 [Nitrosococcus oceani ATCC 19707]KFI20693.1 hypothetical protein IB75_01955 [Nitrosococcus oceani C-27]KFI23785.1 hypothetical protein HW44_02090 [Nitrosococcus oceani]GEM21492.1 hypothetical protein NONS58_29360 [Nitrosococcus oceani]
MNEATPVFFWLIGLQKADLEEIINNLSVEQRARLRRVLEDAGAGRDLRFEAAVQVSEKVLDIIGQEARQLGFDMPRPNPVHTPVRITDTPPSDPKNFPENRRIRFAEVVQKAKACLADKKENKHEHKK